MWDKTSGRQMMGKSLRLIWWAGAAALLLGFAGRLHPLGDSLAVFRPHAAGGLAVVSLVLALSGGRRLGLLGLAAVLAAGATLLPPRTGAPEGAGQVVLYQKNLLFALPDIAPVAADIRASGADVVTLQEMHARNRPILADLSGAYPSSLLCPFAAVGGVAVLSRWPAMEGDVLCEPGLGIAGLRVKTPGGPLWVVSVHLHWPYPHRQADQVARILPLLENLEDPVAMGGDFNMVPWSYTLGAIEDASGTRMAGHAGGTLRLGRDGITLPIDHVLVPESATGASVEARPRLGSDHKGVLARFALPGGG